MAERLLAVASTGAFTRCPTLDDLAHDPASAALLSEEDAVALLLRCAAVQAAITEGRSAVTARKSADRLLDEAQVAEVIGMSRSWVQKHVHDLPPRRSVGGSPRWLLSEIERWMRTRPGYGESS